MRKVILSALLCALSVTVTARGVEPGVSGPPSLAGGASVSESSGSTRQETFEIVWRTVKEKHFDPALGGVDWDKVKEQYAPRAAAVKSDSELYRLLQQMLGELHQSHFNIIPPEAVIEDDVKEPPTGAIGVDVQVIEGQAVITSVEADSPAARAGLQSGFVVTKVNDTAVEQLLGQFAKGKESAGIMRLRMSRSVLARIGGAPGSAVRLSYLDAKDKPGQATVQREKLKGELSQRFGNFPPQYMEFESKRLAGGIGYIRFNIFVMGLMDRIRAAVRAMADAPGIIFDLRGNPGGLGAMSSGIAELLETRQISLGTMHMRSGHVNFAIFPQQNPYMGSVVILIDGRSASTSEVFASGMQEIGRAVIVGERSAGAALPSVIEKLPTGALFQYAIADFRTPKGVLIEGAGVAPDVEVKLSRRTLFGGRDPQLDAAIANIEKRKAAAAKSAVGF